MAHAPLIAHEHVHVEDDADHDRFGLFDGDTFIGFLGYRREGDVIDLQHTIIKEEFSRRGYARALVTIVLERAWGRGERIVPTCSYVADYLRRYPQYQRLVHDAAQRHDDAADGVHGRHSA